MRLARLPPGIVRAPHTPVLLPRTVRPARHLPDPRPRPSLHGILFPPRRLFPPVLFAPTRLLGVVAPLQTVGDTRHELAERRARRVWLLHDVSG